MQKRQSILLADFAPSRLDWETANSLSAMDRKPISETTSSYTSESYADWPGGYQEIVKIEADACSAPVVGLCTPLTEQVPVLQKAGNVEVVSPDLPELIEFPSAQGVVRFFFVLLALLLVASRPASSAEDKRGDNEPFARLEARAANARIGVSAIDVSTNRRVEYRADERFIMCSTFKVLAAAAVLKRVDENREKLDHFVRYGEAQLMAYAPVTREHVKEGGMTLEALCAAAVEQSDNTAANLLLEAIGGPEKRTEFARSLGDKVSRLDHSAPCLNHARPRKGDDTTNPGAPLRE